MAVSLDIVEILSSDFVTIDVILTLSKLLESQKD